jgi:hypothetical protein
MDVTIGEVQAQVESPAAREDTPQQASPPLGPTEKAHRARLEQRRAKRMRDRLHAT